MENQKSTEDKAIEAQQLLDFYIDLMENSKHFLRYYLSEEAVLDWFGQTVKGQKKVATFLKTNVHPVRHLFNEALPTTKIGFHTGHSVHAVRPARRILRSAFLSPPRPTLMFTPVKTPQASTSARRQIGRLELGIERTQNGTSPPSPTKKSKDFSESPRKRQKLSQLDSSDTDILESENEIADSRVKYLTAEGCVEFHRPSMKKLQKETKWQRPCKIHIAYDCGRDIKDSTFYMIIYEGNVKCRRNLLSEFESEEPEN